MKQISGEKPIPPIIYIIAVQLITVIADFFGQRASRVVHKHSESRVIIALSVIGSLTILVLTGSLQIFLPREITSAIYINDQPIQCYQQVDYDGTHTYQFCEQHKNQCTKVQCPTQGPGSIFRSLYLHPQLFMNGLLNLLYYTMEIMVYKHPFGLMLVVISSLASSFFIPFLNWLLFPHNPPADPLSPWVIVLSVFGAMCCMYTPDPASKQKQNKNQSFFPQKKLDTFSKIRNYLHTISVFIPVFLLALAYGIWFTWQFTINEVYHVNTFGYNTIDQALLPIYLVPFMFLLRQTFPNSEEWVHPKEKLHHQNIIVNTDSSESPNANDPLLGISRPNSTVHLSENLEETTNVTTGPSTHIIDQSSPLLSLDSNSISNNPTSSNSYSTVNSQNSDYLLFSLNDGHHAQNRNDHPDEDYFHSLDIPNASTSFSIIKPKPMTFWQVLKLTFEESKWPHWTAVFFYRFFSDVKALTYFLLALFYDLRLVSLELTLVRVAFSWVGTLIGTYFFPSFLRTTPDEISQIYQRKSLILKTIGTGLIIGSLFLIEK